MHVESLPTLKAFILPLPWWISSAMGHHFRLLFYLFVCNFFSHVSCFRAHSGVFSVIPWNIGFVGEHLMTILDHSALKDWELLSDYGLHFLVKYVHEDIFFFSLRQRSRKRNLTPFWEAGQIKASRPELCDELRDHSTARIEKNAIWWKPQARYH